MKIPEARKLPSGSWFVRVVIDGKRISITKPTKKEAEQAAAALKAGAKKIQLHAKLTVEQAAKLYVESRQNVLSVSTVAGYNKIISGRFQKTMKRCIDDMTQEQWQRIVNEEAKLCSAKTLHNAWGFMSSVIAAQTGTRITVRLPQVVRKEAHYISSSDMKKFLDALKGNRYEIPILLGLSGLRRSEIMDIRWEDIDLDAGVIYVRGAAVMDKDNNLVHKAENKSSSSRRTVHFILPQLRAAVMAADKTGEYVACCYPNTLNVVTQRLCEQAGIPKCTTHGLRKSFASIMLVDLKRPEQVVMKEGGWSDPQTMHKIYTQVSDQHLAETGKQMEELFKKW